MFPTFQSANLTITKAECLDRNPFVVARQAFEASNPSALVLSGSVLPAPDGDYQVHLTYVLK